MVLRCVLCLGLICFLIHLQKFHRLRLCVVTLKQSVTLSKVQHCVCTDRGVQPLMYCHHGSAMHMHAGKVNSDDCAIYHHIDMQPCSMTYYTFGIENVKHHLSCCNAITKKSPTTGSRQSISKESHNISHAVRTSHAQPAIVILAKQPRRKVKSVRY